MSIMARLDSAFDRAGPGTPRSIQLSDADWDEFNAAKSAEWGGPVYAFSYRDVQIFPGQGSAVISSEGCAIVLEEAK